MIDLSSAAEWLTETAFQASYAQNLRGSLFTGFLTIGGFLYSAHTFIVIHMKKELYDSDHYKTKVKKIKELSGDSKSMYQPLRNSSRLLLFAVMLSLVTSVCQLTLGLVDRNWAAAICVTLAVLTFGILTTCVVVMTGNMKDWFDSLEEAEKSFKG